MSNITCQFLFVVEFVACQDCGLSFRVIAACIVRDSFTDMQIWNCWIQLDHTERRVES